MREGDDTCLGEFFSILITRGMAGDAANFVKQFVPHFCVCFRSGLWGVVRSFQGEQVVADRFTNFFRSSGDLSPITSGVVVPEWAAEGLAMKRRRYSGVKREPALLKIGASFMPVPSSQ